MEILPFLSKYFNGRQLSNFFIIPLLWMGIRFSLGSEQAYVYARIVSTIPPGPRRDALLARLRAAPSPAVCKKIGSDVKKLAHPKITEKFDSLGSSHNEEHPFCQIFTKLRVGGLPSVDRNKGSGRSQSERPPMGRRYESGGTLQGMSLSQERGSVARGKFTRKITHGGPRLPAERKRPAKRLAHR